MQEQIGEGNSLTFGVCFVDTSTAEFSLSTFSDDQDRTRLETLIVQIKPKELVLEKGIISKASLRVIKNCLGNVEINFIAPGIEFWTVAHTIDEIRRGSYFDCLGNEDYRSMWPIPLQLDSTAISAFGGLLYYLRSLRLDVDLISASNFHDYDPMRSASTLVLDGQTLINLEIFQNTYNSTDQGTLFSLLNHCSTPYGKRLFKKWVCHPLQSIEGINSRLDAVDDFFEVPGAMNHLCAQLKSLPDLERIVSRIHTGTCRVKDFCSSLAAFRKIQNILENFSPYAESFRSDRLKTLVSACFSNPMLKSLVYFENAFDHSEASSREKIQPFTGYDTDFDAFQDAVEAVEAKLNAYLIECQEKVKSKNISYRDIGKEIYQIEVPVKLKAPNDWTLMSKTQAVNRYYSPALRKLVNDILEARERADEAMRTFKSVMYGKFDENYSEWIALIRGVAEVDCLANLAIIRRNLGEPCCRPIFVSSMSSVLDIEGLRHPCLMHKAGMDFIPNDMHLSHEEQSMILLTGPNMGGNL